MVSMICRECGGEARTVVALCPRCGLAFDTPSSDDDAGSQAVPVTRKRNRAGTVCVGAFVGFALWSVQTPGAPENAVVAVGKVEAGEIAQASSELRP